jgi:hypothetical protein
MEFTAKTLADLLGALRSTQSAEIEKRKHPRVGLRMKADIWHIRHGRLTVWLRDLSVGGANLVVPLEMEAGDDLHILFAQTAMSAALDEADKICCKVMHCRKVAPGMHAVGVKFENPPKG